MCRFKHWINCSPTFPGLAQPVRASVLGTEGRELESLIPDQVNVFVGLKLLKT